MKHSWKFKNDVWLKWLKTTSFRLPKLQSSTGKMNDKKAMRKSEYTDNNSCPLPGRYNILINKHSYLHCCYFGIHAFYLNFLVAFLSFILPVEDYNSGSRKLVIFNRFSQRSLLNFYYVSSWLRPSILKKSFQNWNWH